MKKDDDGEDLSYFRIIEDRDLQEEATTAAFLYDTYRLKSQARRDCLYTTSIDYLDRLPFF